MSDTKKYGIVEIDQRDFTWYLPNEDELESCEREEILDAMRLTMFPPHMLDGGTGQRAMEDICEHLEGFLPEEDQKALHTPGGVVSWGNGDAKHRFECRL